MTVKPSRPGDSPMLQVDRLSAGYTGGDIVRDVSLKVERGEMVGLVGRNGSGKSTILLGIAGLIRHRLKGLRLSGIDLSGTPASVRPRAGLGFLLQRHAVFDNLTIGANLKLARSSDTVTVFPRDICPGARSALTRLVDRRNQMAGVLSGGEKRLLAMMMVLGRAPQLVLGDEPTLGLSADLEREVVARLHACAAADGKGVLLVCHNLFIVAEFCARVYIVRQGQIVNEWQGGSSEELVSLVKE